MSLTNLTMKEMLSETSENAAPEYVMDFLEVQFHLSDYESKKQLYLLLMTSKNDEYLQHLENSYTLVNFWKNMYLCVILKYQSSEHFKTERESGKCMNNCLNKIHATAC